MTHIQSFTNQFSSHLEWLRSSVQQRWNTLETTQARIIDLAQCAAIALPMVVAVIYLLITPQTYFATMVVGPNYEDPRNGSQMSGSASSLLQSFTGLDSESSFSPVYTEFLNRMTSPAVAEKLLQQPEIIKKVLPYQYDEKTMQIRGRPGLGFRLREILAGGKLTYHPPGALEVSAFLANSVSIQALGTTAYRRIIFFGPDRENSKQFITALFLATDSTLKEEEKKRAKELLEFISSELGRQEGLANAEMLRSLQERYESKYILSSVSQPMSAEIVEAPNVSATPARPNVVLTLLFGASLSIFLALAIGYYRFIWRARR